MKDTKIKLALNIISTIVLFLLLTFIASKLGFGNITLLLLCYLVSKDLLNN